MVSNGVKCGQTSEERNGGKSYNYPEVKYFRKRKEKEKIPKEKNPLLLVQESSKKPDRLQRVFKSKKLE